MRPASVPETAIPLPPPGGGFLAQQADQIQGIQREVGRENETAATLFDTACTNWTLTNLRNRDLKLPLTPKPAPPTAQVVMASDPDPDGVVWVWIVQDGSLRAPCPDLPPLPVAPGPNHVHILRRITGDWFSAGQDDTYSADGPPVTATADDGTSGIFQKYSAPVGPGWYKKVG
jgi:hypothetical protein